jgi:hypothetical protein
LGSNDGTSSGMLRDAQLKSRSSDTAF